MQTSYLKRFPCRKFLLNRHSRTAAEHTWPYFCVNNYDFFFNSFQQISFIMCVANSLGYSQHSSVRPICSKLFEKKCKIFRKYFYDWQLLEVSTDKILQKNVSERNGFVRTKNPLFVRTNRKNPVRVVSVDTSRNSRKKIIEK